MITIVNTGSANISSVQFSFERLGVPVRLSQDPEVIKKASHVVIPGVGTAVYAMKSLSDAGLIETLKSLTQPVLGICLGMQLLFEFSEEGNVNCLGLIPGAVKKIVCSPEVVVPHMGWNTIKKAQDHAIMKNVPTDSYVYFVHSFAAPISDSTLAITHYGEPFASAVNWNNFYGMQFHPERSSAIGSQLLKNFLEL